MINIRLCIFIFLTKSPSLKLAILHLCSGGLKNYIFSHSSNQGNMRRATSGKIYFLHLMEQISDSCNSFDPPFYCRHKHCTVGSSVGSQPGQGEGTCPGGRGPNTVPQSLRSLGGKAKTWSGEQILEQQGTRSQKGLKMSHTHEEWTESNLNHYQR